MPIDAVKKPTVEDAKDESGSNTESDSDESPPELEDTDTAQQSRVRTEACSLAISIFCRPITN